MGEEIQGLDPGLLKLGKIQGLDPGLLMTVNTNSGLGCEGICTFTVLCMQIMCCFFPPQHVDGE